MTAHRDLWVDCYGHPSSVSLTVTLQDKRVHFAFDDTKDTKRSFHIGLFVDYSTTTGRNYLRYPRKRRIALLSEPNSSIAYVEKPDLCKRFSLILTHDARLLERGAPYVEFPFGTSFISFVLESPPSLEKSKLVSMIGAPHPQSQGGHALRNQAIENLLPRADVDCYGKGVKWIDSKLDGLAAYGFSIAMENHSRDYYFSEKIIDCFLANTVPVYWGCPGITRYFDVRGMLLFDTLPQLESILDSLTWEKYAQMLPFVQSNRQRAISERWATRPQMFERVAAYSLEHCSPLNSHARPTLFRIAQSVRGSLRRELAR